MTEPTDGKSSELNLGPESSGSPFKTWQRWLYVIILLAWPLLSYAVLMTFICSGNYEHKPGEPVDFVRFYGAALLSRQPLHGTLGIYDPQLLTHSIEQVMAVNHSPGLYVYQYPPYFFLLLQPLLLLPLLGAWRLWLVLQVGMLLTSVLIAWPKHSGRALAIAAAFASYPAFRNFRLGHVSLIVLFWLSFFWMFLQKRKYFLAGLCSIGVLLKVQYAPIAVLAGLCVGRLQYLLGLAAVSVALLCATGALMGVDYINAFLSTLLSLENQSTNFIGVEPLSMENLRSMLMLVFCASNGLGMKLGMAAYALVCAWVGWLWYFCHPQLQLKQERAFELCAALTGFAMVVFALHIYDFDCILLVLPYIALWHWLSAKDCFLPPSRTSLYRYAVLAAPIITWLRLLNPLVTQIINRQSLHFATGSNLLEEFMEHSIFWWAFILGTLITGELIAYLARERKNERN